MQHHRILLIFMKERLITCNLCVFAEKEVAYSLVRCDRGLDIGDYISTCA